MLLLGGNAWFSSGCEESAGGAREPARRGTGHTTAIARDFKQRGVTLAPVSQLRATPAPVPFLQFSQTGG